MMAVAEAMKMRMT